MTDQPYQTPQSDVAQPSAPSTGQYGSVEKAIAGDYEFEIGDVIKEAWEKTKGVKGSIIAGIALIYVIVFAIMGGFAFLAPGSFSMSIISQVILTVVLLPMEIGLAMIGLRKSVDQPFKFNMVFQYFGFIVPLILVTIVSYILIMIGLVLLVLPGIYLAIAYSFALMLVVEKKMGLWEAMETSRKAVTKRWFTLFLFWIVMGIILIISMIPIGIGLIWTIPMACVAYGVIYRNMFGVSAIEA